MPLYVGMANHEQADRLANAVRSRLLTPGGILASEYETGEQWDKPMAGHRYNGWQFRDLKCMAMTFWVMKSRAAG